jgi:hypothetical protein
MPPIPPPMRRPSGITNDKMIIAIAKHRSARLHRFQSEIQSLILQCPPVTLDFSAEIYMTRQREKNSTEVWRCGDKETVIAP